MDKELKAKWVAALRSGYYKQTTGLLHDHSEDAYCCLGVLSCIVTGKHGDAGAYGEQEMPPDAAGYPLVRNVLGLEMVGRLQDMNDKDRKTFAEIADYIELSA